MDTKVCFKCREEKPLSEFYAHKKMRDGHLNKCKECTKRDVKSNYRKNRVQRQDYEKRREQDPKRKAAKLEYMRKVRASNPEAYKARTAVDNALRDGRLKKEACVLCHCEERVQAHHPDYSKPLDVVWLCRDCHRRHHGG